MAGQKFLFKNFLADPKVYALNQGYWVMQLRTWLPQESVEKRNLYQTHFANGKKNYDGNPIYSALLKNQKSVRIIQEQPESEQPEIGAWVSQTEVDGEAIQELVISMELTEITKQVVIALVAEWSKAETEASKMEQFIEDRLSRFQVIAFA